MSAIKAIVVESEGVGFYTDTVTGKSGVCETGISILCGVTQQSISKLIKSITTKQPYKGLECLVGKVESLTTKSETGMVLCADEFCVPVIKYYAYKGNETAQFTLNKFITIGFNTWVQSITGWNPQAIAPVDICPEVAIRQDRLEKKMDTLAAQMRHLQTGAGKQKFWVRTRDEALLYYGEECVDAFKSDLGGYLIELDLVRRQKEQPALPPPPPPPPPDPKYDFKSMNEMKAWAEKFYRERGVTWN